MWLLKTIQVEVEALICSKGSHIQKGDWNRNCTQTKNKKCRIKRNRSHERRDEEKPSEMKKGDMQCRR